MPCLYSAIEHKTLLDRIQMITNSTVRVLTASLSLIVFSAFSISVSAATLNAGAFCRPLATLMPERPDLPPLSDEEFVQLYADDALLQEREGISTFSGNVLMQRLGQVLRAKTVIYTRDTEVAHTDSEFTYWSDNLVVEGEGLKLRPNNQGEMHNASYWLMDRRGRGMADTVYQDSNTEARLIGTSFTTCDPDSEVWTLRAEETRIDLTANEGVSKNVTLRVFDVPVFYTPYLSYPLSDARKTGFLAPSMGSSNEVGTEFSIPFYWNLDPSYDLTLTPRVMSRRGVSLGAEFRYLTRTMTGSVQTEYLPNDSSTGENRTLFSFRNSGALTPNSNWFTDIVYDSVSDERYFEEFGTDLSVASTTHLEQRGDLYYFGYGWWGLARVQRFQTLDLNPQARPYARLPQIYLTTQIPEFNRRLNLNGHMEVVRFDRDLDEIPDVVGNRADMRLALSYPWRTPASFVIPQVSFRHTYYSLDDERDNAVLDDSPSRSLYTVSVDSGLFFERDTQLFNNNFLHTLEPRLYYRYTPYKDQSELPVFDTAEYDLTFGQLFRENRYSGADRVDDGNQLTLALTSRLLNSTNGNEYLRGSIGEIFYFDDIDVTLPSQAIIDDGSSSTVAEVAAQLTQYWNASTTVRWNRHDDNTEYSVWRLRYKRDSQHLVNLSYRLRESSDLEQTDVSWYWPVNNRWNMVGRWNYSLRDRKDLEIFAGLEYESCCWAMRGIVRRYLNNIEGDHLNGIFFQVELKGLGGVGRKADTFLEESIPGFQDRF